MTARRSDRSALRVVRVTASAGELHRRDAFDDASAPVRLVRVCEVDAPALVLGSTQRSEVVDVAACADAGVEVVSRHSGGGAVLLVPGEVTWIDVVVDRGRFGDDVAEPMLWFGALVGPLVEQILRPRRTGCERDGVTVARRMVPSRWSRLACFDGFGPGEVAVGGRKLAGLAQRRTRDLVWLQCSWYRTPAERCPPVQERLRRLLAVDVRPPHGALAEPVTVDSASSDRLVGAIIDAVNADVGGKMG